MLMTPATYLACIMFLPETFTINNGMANMFVAKRLYAFYAVTLGIWGGLIIGYTTEYYTSYEFSPTRNVAEACITGAATNIIYGLALGYLSCIIPTIILALTAYGAH